MEFGLELEIFSKMNEKENRVASYLSSLDWVIIIGYLIGLILFSVYLSLGQNSRRDYYVGGNEIGAWPIAISTMATQCSTNSILGAPAFVAFSVGGGLIWLQYELAVPLAMIAIMIFLMPIFRQLKLISVYEYLEKRFDLKTRLVMSGLFQCIRAFATAVTVYGISLVVELITGLSFFWSVFLLGVITAIYDVLGGIKAVVYSDVLQMIILVSVLILVFLVILSEIGGWGQMMSTIDESRKATLDFQHHGWGDGQTYAFWPMVFGGFFLYVSYYGCDQSQTQRLLCTRNLDQGNQALFLNGLLRFPLVLLYCLVGVAIGVYSQTNEQFLELLPKTESGVEYNLAVPTYILTSLPKGVIGLAMVALFAAAMSSLDSVINSLSATTMEDYIRRFSHTEWSERKELWISRCITVFWGSVTLVCAFYVGDISETILETINKVGSLANGPILGVFALGILTKRVTGLGAISGLLSGFLVNVYLWVYYPDISWLWWNVVGFIATYLVGVILSFFTVVKLQSQDMSEPLAKETDQLYWSFKSYKNFPFKRNWIPYYCILFAWFLILIAVLGWIQQ